MYACVYIVVLGREEIDKDWKTCLAVICFMFGADELFTGRSVPHAFHRWVKIGSLRWIIAWRVSFLNAFIS